jgi:hypothetical protein
MLDAGVDLRDVQTAARHADPRTTMRYDRARTNLGRHPNYILAAYDDAAGLRFTSGFNPFFGEYNFTVLFRTKPEGLRTHIADSGFAQPKAGDPSTVLSDGPCPGPLTFRRGLATEMGARRVVIETSDPTHPIVYIEAYDLSGSHS